MKTIILILSILASAMAAADKPRFGDTFTFSLGGMNHHGKAEFSSANTGDEESIIDFDDLGLADEQSVVWAGARWRFSDRWETGLSYTSFSASGGETATRDWSFGDVDVVSSASVTSDFDLDLLILDLTWDFLLTEKAHMGIGGGFHVMGLSLDVAAELDPGIGIGDPIDLGQESESITAPLPNISLVGGYTFTDSLYLGAKLGYFTLDYDKYDGSLTSARAILEWRPWANFGFGLGYQYVDIDLDVDGNSSRDSYGLTFEGPFLVLTAGF